MVQPEKSKRASHPVHRLRSEEAGVAVLTVLLAIVLLLILSSALFLTARLALERAAQTTDSTRALNVAESGMEAAANAIIAQGFVAPDDGTISGSLAGGGDYDVHWDAQTALPWFTMMATGYHPNEANATGVRRITAQVFALNPWDFQYAGGMVGNTVNGNVWVQGPFYVNDELLMSGTAGVHQGPLIIHDNEGVGGSGDLILNSNSADVGSAGSPVPLFIDGQVIGHTESYYADPVYDSAPELEFPELTPDDLADYYYSSTSPSPWQSEEEAPMAVWDVDSTIDGDTALTFSDKTVQPQADDSTNMTRFLSDPNRVNWSYSTLGSTITLTIKFDNTPYGGLDEVRPILFVDGNLTIEASKHFQVRYEGKGTIIANGKISVKGSLVPTGSDPLVSDLSSTTLTGFPETNRLGLITLTEIAYEGSGDDWLAAALYGGGTVSFSKQGNFIGSTVTGALNLGNQVPHLYTQPDFSNKLPPGMPGGDGRITSIMGWTEMTPPSPEASN